MRTAITKYIILFGVILGILFFSPVSAGEGDTVKLTITPPLIKVNMNPGERWTSAIKVVNNNTQPTTVYARAQDFKSGENGGVVFIPKPEEEFSGQSFLLSQWIEIDSGPVEIPAQKSVEIPFSINVPPDAGPGGRYAAILTGTKPGEDVEGTAIKVSSLLASLIMLNIRGDVVERGQIREFSTEKDYYRDPRVKFTVRFENTGNIHLQPQGEIAVYDMYGEELDNITVNHSTEFGNVLPNSTRQWQFEWEGKGGWTRMGRYMATLVIGYGNNGRKTDNRTIYFWVIDFNFLGKVLGGISIIILLFILMIRAYIRRAVISTQRQVGYAVAPGTGPVSRPKIVGAGPAGGIRVIPGGQRISKQGRTGRSLLKYMGVIIVTLVLAAGVIIWYGNNGHKDIKTFQPETGPPRAEKYENDTIGDIKPVDVIADNPEGTDTSKATSTDERIVENEDGSATTTEKMAVTEDEDIEIGNDNIFGEKYVIRVLNGSGESGVAGKAAKLLRDGGFEVESLGNADTFDYSVTVIEYKPVRSRLADEISALLPIVSEKREVGGMEEDIIVIIGKDY